MGLRLWTRAIPRAQRAQGRDRHYTTGCTHILRRLGGLGVDLNATLTPRDLAAAMLKQIKSRAPGDWTWGIGCREIGDTSTMIDITQADITTLPIDAIVNAANNSLLGGGGVDGAIHRAAGPELLKACRGLQGCDTGDAKLTPGFELPATWVIHTVGPVWQGGEAGEAALLERCYRRCFEIGLEQGLKSIAFPCISTGVYSYPPEPAARIAMAVMREYSQRIQRIVACCFSLSALEIYRSVAE